MSKSFMLERAMSRSFVETFLSRSIEKIVGASSVFHKNSGIENLYGKEGEEEEGGRNIKIFSTFFLSQCRKNS